MCSVKYFLGGIGMTLLVVAFTAPAADKPVKPKKAETPEQAIELLAAASRAKDLEAALDQIAQPFHDIMRWYILSEDADVLLDALDQKFGKEPRKGFRPASAV